MKRNIGVIILIALLAIPLAWVILWKNTQFGYKELPVYTTNEMGVEVPYTIDSFKLYDQNGNMFTRDSIGDRIFISNFFFATCPDICPKLNGNVKIATQKLENSTDVLFLSHTVDPYNDTVDALRAYADKFEANDDQWMFLTGRKSTIYHLATESYKCAVQEVPDTNSFIHCETVMLVDKDFRVRGIYDGLDIKSMLDLVEDARFLLKTYKDQEAKKDE